MASSNIRIPQTARTTHEGLAVKRISPEDQLTRLVLAHMLFEDQFYVDGKTAAEQVQTAVAQVSPGYVTALAKTARSAFKLRHVPLLLARELARIGKLKAEDLTDIIQRPDEMGEFLSIYWKDKKQPLSNQVKKGLGNALKKFSEYALAKNDKNSAAVTVRDVMFLTHPKPDNPEQEALFKRIAANEMVVPDTWETNLSAGADKKETFERLMADNKLGALAFIRNLRNMVQAGVSEMAIRLYAMTVDTSKVLPFRYIAAARIMPQFEDMLEKMMLQSLVSHKKLPGKTVLMIDVSGSMFGCKVSGKSDLDRFDAAAALAVLCREICEEVEIFSFSYSAVRVPPRRGFALVEAIRDSQVHGGTAMGNSLREIESKTTYDRVICFTDEQSSDRPTKPNGLGYIINVAGYQNGINQDAWTTVTGFSEAIVDYIQIIEEMAA